MITVKTNVFNMGQQQGCFNGYKARLSGSKPTLSLNGHSIAPSSYPSLHLKFISLIALV